MEMFSKQYSRLTGVVLGVASLIVGLAFSPGDVAHTQQSNPRQQPASKPDPQKPGQKPPQKDEEGQTIRVGTQLVNVLFSVNDKQNKYINDLVKEDVQILEDGKPQEIFIFK